MMTYQIENIFHIEKEFQNIEEYTEKGKKHCQEYIENEEKISEKRKEGIIKEIKKANHFIMKQEIAADLLDAYTSALTKEELSDITTVTGDARKDNLTSVKTAFVVYKAYHEGAKELKLLLKESLDKL